MNLFLDKMDILKYCRSCMNDLTPRENDKLDARVINMFSFCTNIKITNEDSLPRRFCHDCTIKIESAYTFITEAQKVNVTLKNLISRSNTSVIVEPEHLKNKPIHLDIKLTLPDCKVSTSINNYREQETLKNVNEQSDDGRSVNHIWKSDFVKKTYETPIEKDANNDETKKNVCLVCRKQFTSKAWFTKHMQKEHTGQNYTCPHCSKTFPKASQLTSHRVCHEERKFACITCGKRFQRRKQLTVHSRSHTDVRPYACDHCGMRFKVKSILKGHMKLHDNNKPYLCSFCGWSFAQAGNLAAHVRTHTGEKPYACGECSFRAAAACNLRRHQRRHAGAASHVCARCRKGFYDATALTRHERTHTGELPCACPACARAFSDSWKRKSHLMRAHRLALHDIPRMRRDAPHPPPSY